MKILAACPLVNKVDIKFLKKEDEKFHTILEQQLVNEGNDPETGLARQRDTNCLRFIILLLYVA